jgi:hypothetical protein
MRFIFLNLEQTGAVQISHSMSKTHTFDSFLAYFMLFRHIFGIGTLFAYCFIERQITVAFTCRSKIMSTAADFFSGPSLDEVPLPTKKSSFSKTLKAIEEVSAEIVRCNHEIQKWKSRKNKIRDDFRSKLNQVYSIIS